MSSLNTTLTNGHFTVKPKVGEKTTKKTVKTKLLKSTMHGNVMRIF
jgi:hypothetical protein